jgi:putative sigma-54 modulation protein
MPVRYLSGDLLLHERAKKERTMELQIIGKNVKITQSMRDYIQKKVDRLGRYLPGIDDAKVEINQEKTKAPEHRFTVQVTIRSKGLLLRGEERSINANAAMDMVIEVLARQIKRYKGKVNRKEKTASLARQIGEEEIAVTGKKKTTEPELVKVKRFIVKSMTVDESTEQMELLGHDFFLFVNDESGELNLIYRRKDGNYGLIVPEMA